MQQGRVQLRAMMQGRRAEDQIEPSTVRKSHQIPREISKMRPGSLASDVDQRLTDIDADDVIEMLGERPRVAPRPTAGVQSPATMSGQLREQPMHETLGLQTGEAIVVGRETIEGLRVCHVATLALAGVA